MKRLLTLLLAAIACAACSQAPSAITAPPPVAQARAGESFATAVVVPATAPNEGVNFQSDWIYEHYGAFRRDSSGMTAREGRRYDVVAFETRDGAMHTVYFDTTDLFNTLYPPK